MKQIVLKGNDFASIIRLILQNLKARRLLVVCGNSFISSPQFAALEASNIPGILYSDYSLNPLYEEVFNGVQLFRRKKCDAILAVGGGSAIDVAKCIKLFSNMRTDANFLDQTFADTGIPLIAVPTTAGSGSESTQYAAIYYGGRKQSITHESIKPDYVVLMPDFLKTLPRHQKACAMLDALCQGIESWWSVNSTQESRSISRDVVEEILKNMDAYMRDDLYAAERIMLAANLSGRAIAITQTTAAHAMSYQLTQLYSLAHGHAVAVCLPEVWRFIEKNTDQCIDERGAVYLNEILKDIAYSFGCYDGFSAIGKFQQILNSLDVKRPESNDNNDLSLLVSSVNLQRLKNNPVSLSQDVLQSMYQKIVYFHSSIQERPLNDEA